MRKCPAMIQKPAGKYTKARKGIPKIKIIIIINVNSEVRYKNNRTTDANVRRKGNVRWSALTSQ